jgi:succinate-semialdehyde dehydrogenase/glutarate-semialdehyde dehydrogenase
MKSIYPPLALFINGNWIEQGGRKSEPVINPATGETIGEVPHASTHDVQEALNAAGGSFYAWRRTAPLDRSRILRKAAELLRSRVAELGPVVTLESGKPLIDAEREISVAAEMFEWSAEEARRLYGRIIPARTPGIRQMAMLEPVGPVAAFSGWNAPAITLRAR